MPITANAGEYKSPVGLADLYVALVTQDDAAGYVAGTPEYFAPAAEATAEPAVNIQTQYADDAPYDVMSSEGETTIALTVTGIPPEMLALVTGNVFDAVSGRVFDVSGSPPDMALMFRSMKSNGSYRYFSYLKGKFSAPADAFATKSDTPDPKPIQITFTAVRSTHEFDCGGSADQTVKRVWGDADTTNFVATTWYTQVQTPTAVAPSALALSSSDPADNGTGFVVTANLTLTYNNALTDDAITNVSLIKISDYSVVTATITLDTTKKIITINPGASLTGSSAVYLVAANVTDIYGQTLSSAINFTTA